MDPYTGLPWQYPLNGYQTTGNGSRAPLPTSTAQDAVPVGMQFHDPRWRPGLHGAAVRR